MKTKHFLLLFALVIFAAISACKKDEPEPTPISDFTVSKTTATVDEVIQFTNTSDNATSFTWSFGDGTTSTEASPTKSYPTSNVFVVTLSATGAGGTKLSNKNVTILPLSAFTVENEGSLNNITAVQFTNTSKGATSYEWTFGDAGNTTSSLENPTFTYTTGGTYTVTLKATGAGGPATSTKTISVAQTAAAKQLYYIEYGDAAIRKLSLDGSAEVNDVLDITGKGGAGLAFNPGDNKVYFSDFEVVPEGKIWRMNPDGTGLQELASGLTDPYGIALDTDAGKIYWVDDLGNVSRANLDGSSPEPGFLNIPGGELRAIALDLKNDKMYFYEVALENLWVANLDGSNPVALITGVYGYSIFVDSVNDKLYYDEQNSMQLIRSNLDGTGQVTIDATDTRRYGLTIDQTDNKLYWSGRDSGELNRANLDGSDPEVLKSGLASVRGICIKS
ncbi:MAG TPA: PKD domain-containing protein [Saprospiraceae bacterium]|nr:PKD domain-containing protein [Saprospiraceae bacterium]